jgi:hypothetical protein
MGFTNPTTPESKKQVDIVSHCFEIANYLVLGCIPFVRDWVGQRIKPSGWSLDTHSPERAMLRKLFYMRFCEVLANPELLPNPMLIDYKRDIEKKMQEYNFLTTLTKRYYVWPPETSLIDLAWDPASRRMKYPSEALLMESKWLVSERHIDDYLRLYISDNQVEPDPPKPPSVPAPPFPTRTPPAGGTVTPPLTQASSSSSSCSTSCSACASAMKQPIPPAEEKPHFDY